MLRSIPNIITLARIVLIVPTAWLLLEERYLASLVLMAIAGLSDALDGALARRFCWASSFGAYADPLADKLLVSTMFVILVSQAHVPLWLAAVVISRDVIIMLGAGAYRLIFERIEPNPSFISKLNTAMQITMLILVLIGLVDAGPLSGFALAMLDPWGFVVVATLGVSSGVDYVYTWGRRALQERG
ncbi:MAG: CDP-alcohol phosphatidyltransferase family protein [Gammaproteobacteria bacterium]|nr:CDP-alcohol phosphatidyltransferase family protein [Gammaproteobacteria bacterium]